ncbi:MAG: response regulator transcription factor [Pirellulales bacterium]|nr:response regulator transcription factor [Pirellulales bacterium]
MNEEQTVFLVDDDPAVLRSLSALVKVVFPRVEKYESAAAFLQAYTPGRPGCLVLDVAMPGMSGLELQRKLADDHVDLPVIFITGHGNVQMAVGAMRAGAVNFLEKPFREQELWDNIRTALDLDARNRGRQSRRRLAEQCMAQLTSTERRVLDLILEGKINKEIAAELQVSLRTVEDRRARVMKKMGAGSLAELIQLALAR